MACLVFSFATGRHTVGYTETNRLYKNFVHCMEAAHCIASLICTNRQSVVRKLVFIGHKGRQQIHQSSLGCEKQHCQYRFLSGKQDLMFDRHAIIAAQD